jgi:hypothetical protein
MWKVIVETYLLDETNHIVSGSIENFIIGYGFVVFDDLIAEPVVLS